MSDFTLPKDVDEFMTNFEKSVGKSYLDAVKEKVNPDADIDYAKEHAANQYYKKLADAQIRANIEPPNYLQYYKAFNPTGQYANVKNYRKKNETKNPELKDLSDAEIANKVFDQFKQIDPSNMPEFEPWINDWAPKFEKDYQLGGQRQVDYSKKELIKLSGSDVKGIDTNMLRLAKSLAFDEDTGARQMKIMVADTFNVSPDEVEFRKNPKSGALEFLNPETKRYQVVNAPGLDIGDFYSISGDLMVAIPEVVGGILLNRVKALSITPPLLNFAAKKITGRGFNFNVGAGVGSFIGGATGELMRVQLGNMFFKGMNPEVTDAMVLKQAGQAGVVNALFTKLGLGAVNTFKFFQKGITFGKSKFNDIDFKDFNLNTEEAQEVAEIMNRKMEEVGITRRVKFNIAEASNDLKLKQSLAALETDPSVGINGKITKMRVENAETFVDFFKTGLPEGALVKQGDASERIVGEFITDALEKGKSGELAAQKKLLKTSKANLDKRFERMDKKVTKKVDFNKKTKKFEESDELISFNQQSGEFIRSAIQDVVSQTANKYTKKFAKFGDLYGDTPIGLSEITNVLDEFDARKAETLFKNFTSARTLFNGELIDQGNVSMKFMMNTMSDLKSFQRMVATGLPGTEGVQVGQIKRLIGAVDNQLKKSLGEKSVAYTKYKKLVNDYADDMKKTNGVLSKILEVKGGVPVIQNEDVFQQTYRATLPGKEARIDAMMEIMKNRPRVLTNFKQNILKDYKQQVYKNGKFNLDRHNAYIADENYGYALKKVFGSDNFGKISKVGGLIKNVENAVEAEAVLVGKLKKATNGLLETNDPATVFKKVYNTANPELLKDVVKILGKDKNQLDSLKKVVMDDVLDKTTDADGHFVPKKFKDYFKRGPKSQGSLFSTVFADDKSYLDNIEVLRKAMDITMRKAPARDVTTVENWLNHVIRSRVGVFTPEGRALTAVTAISQNAYKKRLAQILSDPDKVAKLAALEKIKIPKDVKGFDKIEELLKNKQAVTQIITDVFGYVSGTYPATGAAPAPTDMDIEKELLYQSQKVSGGQPSNKIQITSLPEDKKTIQTSPLDNIKSPTDIGNNLLAEVSQPQVAQTELPAPAPASSGIGALNPQAQAANYAGLFPEDNLGQAIANQGVRRG